jgi:hypothetical protein
MGVHEIIAMNVVGPSLRVGGQVGKRADGKARGAILGTFGRGRNHATWQQVAARASPPVS